MRRRLLPLLALLVAGASPAGYPAEWSRPTRPFHIAGPVYYVGTEGLGSYLIATRAGLILLDGTIEENVPAIERNIAALGFRVRDVKLLINSHAHWDHAAGLAALKLDTGAPLAASAGDRGALETGVAPSETSYGTVRFPPVKVDRVLADGSPVSLGGVTLTPVLTPGHTPGCTTWTTDVAERGRTLHVVFLCSLTVAGNRLVGNRGYPGIVADYRRTFARLRTVPADVVLTAHPELADVLGRARRQAAGERDAFLAPGLLPKLVGEAQTAFDADLARETAR